MSWYCMLVLYWAANPCTYIHVCTIHGFFDNRKYFDLVDNGGLPPLGDSYIYTVETGSAESTAK